MLSLQINGKQSVQIVITVASISAPVFVLAMIGYMWVRLGHDYPLTFVTHLTMSISVPCLIFVALMRIEINPRALIDLTLAGVVSYVVIGLVWAALLRLGPLDQRTYLAPLTFGNTGNLGLPLALFAFGQAGMNQAVVVFAIMAIGSFTWGVWHVSGGGSIRKVFTEPLVWGTSLGAVFLVMGWQTPDVVTNTVELIGQMAIPLMLITLGVAVARLQTAGIRRAVILSGVKIVLGVAVAWAAAQAFGLPHLASAVLIVQMATPVAVTSYFLAEKYGADGQEVAGLVVTSTVMSVVGLPLILAWVL